MQESSRFYIPSKFESDIRATPRAMDTLRLFNDYRLLPLNWMYALIGDTGSYDGYSKLCRRMVKRAGLLSRFTFNGTRNTNETMTYLRTAAGDRFLFEKGFVGLPHDGTHDAHQVLTDLADAQIQLGLRGTDVELHKWQGIVEHPATPKLPDKPFRFDYPGGRLIPDGRPFYLKRGRDSILFLKEIDRATEGKSIITDKLRAYKILEDEIKRRYGFTGALGLMLLIVTTDEVRRQSILKLIAKIFPNGCRWILVALIDDHIKHTRSTAPVVTDIVDKPCLRAGAPPYSLKTLGEVR
jgi:hypothetical protein